MTRPLPFEQTPCEHVEASSPCPLCDKAWDLACVDEAERRLAEHERLGGPTFTWEEVRAEIQERLKPPPRPSRP